MTERLLKNVAHSVHQRLLKRARETSRPFNELLQYYAIERFLYRLSQSPHADRFVLKGALMLIMWDVPVTRPTRDIDLLGRTDNSPEVIAAVVREVCVQEVEPDGLEFDLSTVEARSITEGADYRGVRVTFEGRLGNAIVYMQVDVGFGDVVSAEMNKAEYPTILNMPVPRLRGYTRESTIAEKHHAMVKLGELNSRMRDFYDIWLLSGQFEFDGQALYEAIRRTFATRGTEIAAHPVAFRDSFARDETKQAQWRAFLRKSVLSDVPASFGDIVGSLADFLGPVLAALSQGRSFSEIWTPPGPWR